MQEDQFDEVHDFSPKTSQLLLSTDSHESNMDGVQVWTSFWVLDKDLKAIRVWHGYRSLLDGANSPASFDIDGNIILKLRHAFQIYSRFPHKLTF